MKVLVFAGALTQGAIFNQETFFLISTDRVSPQRGLAILALAVLPLCQAGPTAVSEWDQHDPAISGDCMHRRQVVVETESLISVMSCLLGKYLQMPHPPS